MAELGANDDQLDFPILYAVARDGKAYKELDKPQDDMHELFDMVLEHIPAPSVDVDAPFQMLVTNLDYNEYLGRIVPGRVKRGTVKKGEFVQLMRRRRHHDQEPHRAALHAHGPAPHRSRRRQRR